MKSATGEADPAFFPNELASARGIDIQDDINDVAERVAEAIREKSPGWPVGTPLKPWASGPHALLSLSFACRCKQRGAPDGFYVKEAVVYAPAFDEGTWHEPARVLFYWNDGGDPAWKHVAESCFNERVHSRSCLAAFRAADISFTDDLAAALGRRDGH